MSATPISPAPHAKHEFEHGAVSYSTYRCNTVRSSLSFRLPSAGLLAPSMQYRRWDSISFSESALMARRAETNWVKRSAQSRSSTSIRSMPLSCPTILRRRSRRASLSSSGC
jgi:hypothetical protein